MSFIDKIWRVGLDEIDNRVYINDGFFFQFPNKELTIEFYKMIEAEIIAQDTTD